MLTGVKLPFLFSKKTPVLLSLTSHTLQTLPEAYPKFLSGVCHLHPLHHTHRHPACARTGLCAQPATPGFAELTFTVQTLLHPGQPLSHREMVSHRYTQIKDRNVAQTTAPANLHGISVHPLPAWQQAPASHSPQQGGCLPAPLPGPFCSSQPELLMWKTTRELHTFPSEGCATIAASPTGH